MASEEEESQKKLTLTEAAEAGDLDSVKGILDAGCQVDKPDEKGSSALLVALWRGHDNIAELLLERGADPNITDMLGLSALHVACVKGNLEAVKLLLDRGRCDANGSRHSRTPPPIHFAVGSNEDIVLFLIKCGADVLSLHGSGDPPLFRAVTNGQNRMVKIMLSAASPDLSFINHDDDNIFQCMFKSYTIRTASKNHCEILETLLDYAKQNETQLQRAKEALTKAMPCLIRNGCITCFQKALPFTDIKHKYDEFGTDMLQIAMTSGTCWSSLAVDWTFRTTDELDDCRLEMVKRLLEAGTSLSATKENVIGQLWNSRSIRSAPTSSLTYVYYVRAWGGWYPNDENSNAAFQDFALYLMDNLARLVCWAGYNPNEKHLDYLTTARTKQKQKRKSQSLVLIDDAVTSSPASDHADNFVDELWTNFALNARPLTNLAAICIRRWLCDNVLYKVKALCLPQRLQDHITLKTITDQMQISDIGTNSQMLDDRRFFIDDGSDEDYDDDFDLLGSNITGCTS